MVELFEGGRIVEWILAGMVIEAVALSALAIRQPGRWPIGGLLLNLLAGASLLLALRTVLVGGPSAVTGAWLSAALIAHIADVTLRVRRRGSS